MGLPLRSSQGSCSPRDAKTSEDSLTPLLVGDYWHVVRGPNVGKVGCDLSNVNKPKHWRREEKMAKIEKTTCPVSAADFKKNAKPLVVTIGDKQVIVPVKEFQTGSFGWYINEKVVVMVGDVPVSVQVGANLIVVGSKEAAKK